MNDIIIRNATIDDAKEILDIYAYYVKNTAISFEYEIPSIEEFTERIENTIKKYPYFVAVKNDKIAGYCYANPFIKREAYDKSCETTIYIDKNHKREKTGKLLYETLERELKKREFLNLYACIGIPEKEDDYLNFDSKKFHEYMGFKTVGTFSKCGYKFNRWYNMIWMEKIIGKHE